MKLGSSSPRALLAETAAYDQFLRTRKADLGRIARATFGQHSLEDLEQAAWVIAADLASERGVPVSFTALPDQELILGRLYNRHVRSKSVRYAVSLDGVPGPNKEEQGNLSLLDVLEHPGEGPVALLEAEEQQVVAQQLLRQSYSEAVAYVLLLMRFGRVEVLAVELGVMLNTLRVRMLRARDRFGVQPSLFDGLESIDPCFAPTRQHWPRKQAQADANGPAGWSF